jgi:hypothetical protein
MPNVQRSGFCRDCRYFAAEQERSGEPPRYGRCRRHAPGPCSDSGKHGYWPLVHSDDWCGEFKSRVY